jgi:hypothetical protein
LSAGRKIGAEKRKERGKGSQKKVVRGRRFSFCPHFSASRPVEDRGLKIEDRSLKIENCVPNV